LHADSLPGGSAGQLGGGQIVPEHSQYWPVQMHCSLAQPSP